MKVTCTGDINRQLQPLCAYLHFRAPVIYLQTWWGGGVQQQKRSCHREKPKMSFVFFVLICSFAKYVQHRRFCAEVGQNCDLLSSFLFFLVVFAGFGQQNVLKQRTKKNKKIMPPGKLQDVLCLFCCWTPPPPSNMKHHITQF